MEIELSPMQFARRARRLYADREAIVDGVLRLNYQQFFERCDRWSTALQALGVSQGDKVAYIAPNTHAQLESFYSVPQIGAVVVPINYRLSGDDFVYIINHCDAKVVCVHSDYLDVVAAARAEMPNVIQFVALEGLAEMQQDNDAWLDYETLLQGSAPEFEPVAIAENDLISINYTSGTTARPKGVMITHRNAYLNIVGTLLHFPVAASDRYLWTLPMFHANGWTFVWIITARGAAHICLRQVAPDSVFESIRNEHANVFCAAPTVLIGIANAPAQLRQDIPQGIRLITAGAPPAAATIERIEVDFGWQLTQAYGLTETAPLITVCEERPEHLELSASERATLKARQGVELLTSGELVVRDDDGNEVAHDGRTMGEISVRGNVVMKGYYNAPEATASAIRDGWFYSGDAAVVHPDGYVEIRDRLKDVIISGGENISSVEIEGVLLRHPAVQEVSVVGMPHEKWGESPHAFVVLKPGAQTNGEELRAFVRERLAKFKTPEWFSFLEELPKTATGKVQKYVLRGGSAISKQ